MIIQSALVVCALMMLGEIASITRFISVGYRLIVFLGMTKSHAFSVARLVEHIFEKYPQKALQKKDAEESENTKNGG